jgi:hypothetical protein
MMNSADSNQPQDQQSQPIEPEIAVKQPVVPRASPIAATLTRLESWLHSQGLPAPGTLAAVVLAGFLIFPAYRGLVSGGTIRRLREEISDLKQALKASKARSDSLTLELSQQNLQLLQRDSPRGEMGSGLFVSPLVSLERTHSTLPDLIRISFAHSKQAVLVFHPTALQVEEIEARIFQGGRLVWNQILPYSSGTPASPSVVTLILSDSVLSPGNYQLDLTGNPSKQRTNLVLFDLTVEK